MPSKRSGKQRRKQNPRGGGSRLSSASSLSPSLPPSLHAPIVYSSKCAIGASERPRFPASFCCRSNRSSLARSPARPRARLLDISLKCKQRPEPQKSDCGERPNERTKERGRAPQMIIVREAYNKTIFHRAETTLLPGKNFVYPSS